MDVLSALPQMKASELIEQSDKFANTLIEKLDEFNLKHPSEKMAQGEAIPGPAPSDFKGFFKVIFCAYMASRRVITS